MSLELEGYQPWPAMGYNRPHLHDRTVVLEFRLVFFSTFPRGADPARHADRAQPLKSIRVFVVSYRLTDFRPLCRPSGPPMPSVSSYPVALVGTSWRQVDCGYSCTPLSKAMLLARRQQRLLSDLYRINRIKLPL